MLYTGYDIQRGWLAGAGWIAQKQADFLNNFATGPFSYGAMAPIAASALDGIAVKSKNLNSDMHASAEYRAHLITVMAKRAVDAAK